MLDYLQAFPEVMHHPKKDQFLFSRQRIRHPDSAVLLDGLEREHREGSIHAAPAP